MSVNNLIVPRNREAEIALLGCVFLDESLMLSINDEISYTDFYDDKNREIFKAMTNLYISHQSIDITTLCSELERTGKLNNVGVEYINQIANSTYTTTNIDDYIRLVKDTSLKRKAISVLSKLTQDGYNPNLDANEYITSLEKEVFELSKSKKTSEFVRINDVVEIVKRNVEINSNRKSTVTGLNTGFSNLNKATLGLQNGNLIILAARPAMGKSAFAMNLAVQVAEGNNNSKAAVAIFSLEMGADQLVERMISSEAHINSEKIKKGEITGTDGVLFSGASEKLSELNLYFDDSASITVEDIRAKCRKLKADQGLDLVIIDYLQLIKGDSSKPKHEEIGAISRSLKLMARELNIPVVALAQLSRDVEKREDKNPIMADLRDSGNIEQDADIIMFLYREEYYKKNSNRIGEADLIIAKNRSGTTGKLKFQFEGQYSKFSSMDAEE
ncbi:MAG: replicative DNA helicase [Anaeroplasmataceae bacterium]